MNDIESRLGSAPVARAPRSLDERVEDAFRSRERRTSARGLRRTVPLWVAAAACAAGVAAGLLLPRPDGGSGSPPDDAIVRMETVVAIDAFVARPNRPDRTGAFERPLGEVEVLYVAGRFVDGSGETTLRRGERGGDT